ncbi:hypothetical protein IW262DRAFT_680500 [Armillaria fumosa]|nr:hypothetical protein IW262DRAFT_680500 [Armillaria fumosa]
MNKEVPVGVYRNLFSLVEGSRLCIGWRFAVLELHTFLIEIINTFEFSMATEAERIWREACTVMTPAVEGAVKKGSQLPLRVVIASCE